MAKSSRSSSVKKNNQRLKSKVFKPAELERDQRLSAKLLELAQQPKPSESKMDTDGDEGRPQAHADSESNAQAGACNAPSLSVTIPKSLCQQNAQLPTPPDSPTSSSVPLDQSSLRALAREELFFHMLGASSEILGFDINGDLCLGFGKEDGGRDGYANSSRRGADDDDDLDIYVDDADSKGLDDMEVDGKTTATAATTTTKASSSSEGRSISAQKKAKAAKAAKIEKKRRRLPRNTITFPSTRSQKGKGTKKR
ncbi:hypothetical protein K431DRAFT_295020 [Polychaeton citri CBS 116435]|uniref:DUF2423 domain-containing protein n=1 Tax=Polychaeton citri CBS 116435 TaxID=1314669 RepID=A0A9P4Q6L5_9PEZI|nr:hypothetical protein K431DRAFT_295020 [Polychaeton citri CBS 116435]